MNLQSIQSSFSPFQLLARKLNQYHRVHAADTAHTRHLREGHEQPQLTRNPQKILENNVVSELGKAIGSDNITPAKIDDHAFHLDRIADRILAYVKKAYGEQQNSDPNFDQANFFTQVRQGIDEGFSSARNALDAAGLLSGEQVDSLNAAYANIQDGLDKLEAGVTASGVPVAQLQGISAQINQSTEIEIVTKEGDIVKIQLTQSASGSQRSVSLSQDGVEVNAQQNSTDFSSNFSVSVEGDLNEDEQHALKKLLKRIDNVREDFFDGNIREAFRHAKKIGLDTEQLASFSLNLSFEQSIQAVAAYQQVAQPEQQVDTDKIKQAADFFNHAKDLLDTAQSALQPFENPPAVFQTLFERINLLAISRHAEQAPVPADGIPDIQQIIKPLSDTLLGNDPAVAATGA
ncbi:MAG: DUF5610 domain-containing protein [Methylococcaceae bacterium]|nr:DUF5610 domain-containing protein [Methylococcaceae bacterium]